MATGEDVVKWNGMAFNNICRYNNYENSFLTESCHFLQLGSKQYADNEPYMIEFVENNTATQYTVNLQFHYTSFNLGISSVWPYLEGFEGSTVQIPVIVK
jgi:hypothetical protein